MPSAHSQKTGYKNPPAEHQFSATNQPSRRRKKVNSQAHTDLLQYLIDALDQTIEVTKRGKHAKITVLEAIMQQLAAKTLQGGASEQRKLVELLIKSGYVDFAKFRDELEESYARKLTEKEAEYTRLVEFLAEMGAAIKALMDRMKIVGEAFLKARDNCSCGSCDELKDVVRHTEEWLAEADEAFPEDAPVSDHGRNWSPRRSAGDISEEYLASDDVTNPSGTKKVIRFKIIKKAPAADDDKNDPFYTGMINSS